MTLHEDGFTEPEAPVFDDMEDDSNSGHDYNKKGVEDDEPWTPEEAEKAYEQIGDDDESRGYEKHSYLNYATLL